MFVRLEFFKSIQFYIYLVIFVFAIAFASFFAYFHISVSSEKLNIKVFNQLEKSSLVLQEMIVSNFFNIKSDIDFVHSRSHQIKDMESLFNNLPSFLESRDLYAGISLLNKDGYFSLLHSYYDEFSENDRFKEFAISVFQDLSERGEKQSLLYLSDLFYLKKEANNPAGFSEDGVFVCARKDGDSVVLFTVRGEQFMKYFYFTEREYNAVGIQLLNGKHDPRYSWGYIPFETEIFTIDDFSKKTNKMVLNRRFKEKNYLSYEVAVNSNIPYLDLDIIPFYDEKKTENLAYFRLFFDLDPYVATARSNYINIIVVIVFSVIIILALLFFIGYLNYIRGIANRELMIASEIFKNAGEGIIIANSQYSIIYANDSFLYMYGKIEVEKIVNQSIDIIHSVENKDEFFNQLKISVEEYSFWKGEISLDLPDGGTRPCLLTVRAINNGRKVDGYIGIFEDLEILKLKEQQAKMLENYDSLTGLPNAYLFRNRLKELMLEAGKENQLCAVIVVSINDYKKSLETYGQSFGSDFLKIASETLNSACRSTTMIARLEGDTFGILLSPRRTRNDFYFIVLNIFDYLKQPIRVHDETMYLKCNAGISVFPEDGSNTDLILKNAHVALKASTEKGPNKFKFYKAKQLDNSVNLIRLESYLRESISDKEFALKFQPQIRIEGEKLTGCEALIRWNHKKIGFVSPGIFIPLAENSGLINDIGDWVMRRSFEQVVEWGEYLSDKFRMSVNISPHQFNEKYFIQKVDFLIKETGVKAENLEFEITEGVLVNNREYVVKKLNELKDRGITIALDDFGTGYSSLSYIKDFPLDRIKIDRSFIMGYPESDDGIVARIIVDMTRVLNLEVIAEGVETLEQLKFLSDIGCHSVQGFYYSCPIDASEFVGKFFLKK
ncbi:MAG: EAL domain-containing protein [Spirochaetales bacterium]|nr:EAL domain-containing protein [Spirochaetales bacterium]